MFGSIQFNSKIDYVGNWKLVAFEFDSGYNQNQTSNPSKLHLKVKK